MLYTNDYQELGQTPTSYFPIKARIPVTWAVGTHLFRVKVTYSSVQGGSSCDPFPNSDYFILPVSITRPTGGLSGRYDLDTYCTVDSLDTLKLAATAELVFSDSGRIVVKNGGVIQFMGRQSGDDPDAMSWLHGDSTITSTGDPRIFVEAGGAIIGKHVRIDGLPPVAIGTYNGKIVLDSAHFEACEVGINADAVTDTIRITHSTFQAPVVGINLACLDSNGIRPVIAHCTFTDIHQQGVSLNKIGKATISGCTFTGNGNGEGEGLYLEMCNRPVEVTNSSFRYLNLGVRTLYTSALFQSDSIEYNTIQGMDYNYDQPDDPAYGGIESCIFRFNGYGNNDGNSGVVFYAASPFVKCSHFSNNYPYAVSVLGNAAPMFYNAADTTVGSNRFYGCDELPLIYIVDSAPAFRYGENEFNLPVDGLYMMDASDKPSSHNIKENVLSGGDSIIYFFPDDPDLWPRNSINANVCGAKITDFDEQGESMMLRGDLFYAAGQTDSATYYYQSVLAASGDTTAAGKGALFRLAKINPLLPSVDSNLTMDRWYNASYGYDAVHQFMTADAYRDSILTNATAMDSLRVEYDLANSELLRPQLSKAGHGDAAALEEARSHRADLKRKLLAFTKPKAIPQWQHEAELPTKFALRAVYPNPFNPIANVRFDLPEASEVKIAVYDAMGRLVTTLVNGKLDAGYHEAKWDGTRSASGVYFVTIHANKFVATRKAVLLK